jgi:carboxymethylenebutenolidase
VSRTIGADHVVDEIVLRCTHDREVPALLPGVPPTGKLIELPHVVLMRFEDGRVAHEHIYWDQASLLAQVGLIDTAGLPVMGAEQANGLLACLRSAPAAAGRPRPELGAVFDAHVAHKFVDKNVHLTMTTMTADPYVYNVPTGVGGDGRAGVERFYREMLVGVMPADTAILPISRTVGADRVVDELVLSFTHDVPIGFMLPGIAPTGRSVALPYVVVMGFDRDQVAHEHIYWDQGSLLVQVGLLDPARVPAVGAEPAAWLLDRSQPLNRLLSG